MPTTSPAPHRILLPIPPAVCLAILLVGVSLLVVLFCSYQALATHQALTADFGAPAALNSDASFGIGSLTALCVLIPAVLSVALVWRQRWVRTIQLQPACLLVSAGPDRKPALGRRHGGQRAARTAHAQLMAALSKVTVFTDIVAAYLLWFSASGRAWFRRDEPEHA